MTSDMEIGLYEFFLPKLLRFRRKIRVTVGTNRQNLSNATLSLASSHCNNKIFSTPSQPLEPHQWRLYTEGFNQF